MANERTFKAIENTVGSPNKAHRIIFSSMAELEAARQAIADGRDLLIEIDGTVISHKNHEISYQIYQGKIVLGARTENNEKEKEEEE